MPEVIIVSYSELSSFRDCPLKHMWGYKQRWTQPKDDDAATSKGTAWHHAMEAHHGVLMAHQKTGGRPSPQREREILSEARDRAAETWDGYSQASLIEWMYDGYVEFWGVDRDYRTVGLEVPFQVPLPTPAGRDSHYHLKGKIDRLMVDRRGKLWIEDHKSCANLPSEFELQLDDQFGLYEWAVTKLGHPVMGTIHSAARTTRNAGDYPGAAARYKPQTLDQRFHRTYMNRTKRELAAIAADAYAVARNAYPPKSMQLPLYSAPDPRQCGWKCDFKDVHLMVREGGATPETAMRALGFEQDFTRH